jgi:hypothetical protein
MWSPQTNEVRMGGRRRLWTAVRGTRRQAVGQGRLTPLSLLPVVEASIGTRGNGARGGSRTRPGPSRSSYLPVRISSNKAMARGSLDWPSQNMAVFRILGFR